MSTDQVVDVVINGQVVSVKAKTVKYSGHMTDEVIFERLMPDFDTGDLVDVTRLESTMIECVSGVTDHG